MQVDTQGTQDPGARKIRALLLAAAPELVGFAREVSVTFLKPLETPGAPVPNRSSPVGALKERVGSLRAEVEGTAVQGATAVSARDLSARALLETEQAFGKLAESYAAPDQRSSTILLAESVRLLAVAKATGLSAGKALNIPWPLQ